jgi:hypothetical protein
MGRSYEDQNPAKAMDMPLESVSMPLTGSPAVTAIGAPQVTAAADPGATPVEGFNERTVPALPYIEYAETVADAPPVFFRPMMQFPTAMLQ